MSYSNGKYTAPAWVNGAAPAISAANLKDISAALQTLTSFLYTEYVTSGQKAGTTLGSRATAEGYKNTASGNRSHAEGEDCIASGENSHAEGHMTQATGSSAHAEGFATQAARTSHAEGYYSLATGEYSHAEGQGSESSGDRSHSEGTASYAIGYSSHAEGDHSRAQNYASHASGKYNKIMKSGGAQANTTGDVIAIGNGTSTSARSNCFRVTYAGEVYGLSAFKTTGADYAEYFEWEDGNPDNEDRVGYFVTVKGKHIRKAAPGDYILGVVSGQPCIIGNADEDWMGRWVHDPFGRFVKEYLETEETQVAPPEGMEEAELHIWMMDNQVEEREGKYFQTTEKIVDHETTSWRYKANPDYDNTQPYVERRDRKEWDADGMLGVVAVRDDGSCQVDGYCKVAEGGIATAAGAELEIADGKIIKGYRVLERVADNIVKIVFR